jgi:oligoendopeptidase F
MLNQTWELESVFSAWSKDRAATMLGDFSKRLESLKASSAKLNEATDVQWDAFIRSLEDVFFMHHDLSAASSCLCAQNVDDKEAIQFTSKLSAISPDIDVVMTNFEMNIRELSPTRVASLIESSPLLKSRAFFIRESANNARFKLDRPLQALASELGVDGLDAWGRLYERISGQLRVKLEEGGEQVEKSPGQVLYDSPDRAIRIKEFTAVRKAWQTMLTPCAAALNHLAGTRLTLYKRLGLQDHMDMPLHQNRLARRSLEAMWAVVDEQKQPLLDYLAIKAKKMGVAKLSYFDLAADVVTDQAAASLSYDESAKIVLNSMESFGPGFRNFSQRAYEHRWIEAANRKGKGAGGFCTFFPTAKQSRIFLTYRDNWEGAQTIAHELGHAYHSYVMKDLPLTLQFYPMNLAETASTFAEHLLLDERLRLAKGAGERFKILSSSLDDAVAFVCNVQARFLFEDQVYRSRKDAEADPETMCQWMSDAQRRAYGGMLDENGLFPEFWASKMHFFFAGQSFYNFPYTFGYLLSLALFDRFKADPTNFPKKYDQFLSMTGSASTEDAIQQTLGLDVGSKDFWRGSFAILNKRLAQLQECM